jgi:hypothetical protein
MATHSTGPVGGDVTGMEVSSVILALRRRSGVTGDAVVVQHLAGSDRGDTPRRGEDPLAQR